MSEKPARIGGLHAVRAALDAHADAPVRAIWVTQGRNDRRITELVEAAASLGVSVHRVDPRELDRMLAGVRHQGIAAEVRLPETHDEHSLRALIENADRPALLLVLDGVTDPHNLGACLRSAEAAGALAVVAPRDRAVGLTPTVAKVAAGAAGRIPFVQVTNLARTLRELQGLGLWLVGMADGATQSLYATDLSGPVALVLGAEGAGLRRLTAEQCDFLARIPMAGAVESLNVSVAAGVCLFEAVRQRAAPPAR